MLSPPQGRLPRAWLPRSVSFLSLLLLAPAVGCGKGDSVGPRPQATTIKIKAGDGQRASPGSAVPIAPSVAVTDDAANPVSGVPITFQVTSGGGSVSPLSPVNTDEQGTAAVTSWTLGTTPGANSLSASGTGLTGVVFTATGLVLGTIRGTLTVSDQLVAAAARAALAQTGATSRAGGKARGLASRRSPIGFESGRGARSAMPRYSPDELIVRYRPQAVGAPQRGASAMILRSGAAQVAREIRAHTAPRLSARGAVITGISPTLLAARIRVQDPAALGEMAAELRQDAAVASVERNGMGWRRESASGFIAARSANDPLGALQAWNHAMIDLPEAWSLTTGSASVLVALVDDGIRFDHPDIAPNLTSDGYDFVSNDFEEDLCSGGKLGFSGDGDGYDGDPTIPSSYDFVSEAACLEGPLDLGGHGVSMAGIIGAVSNNGIGVSGINWAVRIRPVRVLNMEGAGFTYDVAQGILYAAGLPADDGAGGVAQAPTGAKVINMSLSGPSDEALVREAVVAATNAGALIISGPGNHAGSTPEYPGAYPEVVSASAVGPDRELASYSSFGPTVDLAAPGGDSRDGDDSFSILSTIWDFSAGAPEYGFLDGFSPAAAHVTGVAALVLAKDPGLSPSQLRARLTDFAVDAGAPGRDDRYGAGILNARNSIAGNLGPPRQLRAVLYDASSGAIVESAAAAGDGSYSFAAPVGSYQVFGGQDESGDGVVGLPGRRWGAFGGTAKPSRIEVQDVATHEAPFTVGFPSEVEPNGTMDRANTLPIGGYLTGVVSAGGSGGDNDIFQVLIPQAGQYTFETSGVDGACGLTLEEDTALELDRPDNAAVEGSIDLDDIDPTTNNFCSRLTATLQPGTYYLRLQGERGGRYRVQARSGT